MEKKQLIPLMDCLNVNVKENIVALHETGHVITMYALNMMDSFDYVTIKSGPKTDGLTKVTDEYITTQIRLNEEKAQVAFKTHSGKDVHNTVLGILESYKSSIFDICRLFGGASICRFYEVPDEKMCSIDYKDGIDNILARLGLPDTRETLKPFVDKFLSPVFASLDLLTKAIYKNLVKFETLDKDQVMQIIKEWEEFKW